MPATKTRKNSSKPKVKVEQIITDKILEALDAGIVPWRKGFSAGMLHRSLKSGKVYRNSNQMLTQITAMVRGFESPYWLTWNNVKDFGGKVKDGEEKNYTLVTFYKRLKVEDTATGNDKTIPLLRYFRVYNLDQCEIPAENLPKRILAEMVAQDFDAVAEAEAIVDEWLAKPTIVHSKTAGCGSYNPSADTVTMPDKNRAETSERYYSTLFHELVHSSGHPSRLNRKEVAEFHSDKSRKWGDDPYSTEELVAEMGAAFLSGHAGITDDSTIANNAAYIDHWRKKLSDDPKLIIQSGTAAQKAVDMILGTKFEDAPAE